MGAVMQHERLSAKQAAGIRRGRQQGLTVRTLATCFGTSTATVCRVLSSRWQPGSTVPRRRRVLTAAMVAEARALNAAGVGIRTLAKRYGASPSTMHDACRGETWAWVP